MAIGAVVAAALAYRVTGAVRRWSFYADGPSRSSWTRCRAYDWLHAGPGFAAGSPHPVPRILGAVHHKSSGRSMRNGC